MVLKALDQIRAAEEQAALLKVQAQAEIAAYEQAKQEHLLLLQTASQEKVACLAASTKAEQTERLQKEKLELVSEAEKQTQDFDKKYGKNKDRVLHSIIERVKKNYGSE
ncbi:hypothetical protein GIX45_10745 [Erwinia sp. CPCC 100877]|nr:hypothetical protein [Erwinia sp. CPCC 100877]